MCSLGLCSQFLLWEVLAGLLILGIIIYLVVKQIGKPAVLGDNELVGKIGEVREKLHPEGQIFVNGEIWKAISRNREEIKSGEKVKILKLQNFTLVVEQINEEVQSL